MNVDVESNSPLAPLVRIIPIVIGVFAFGLVVGGKILAPTNVAWLQHGDSAQHYLGWAFYRNSHWTFPVGLNPLFGLELASSIVYSDSIPLLAMFFKLFGGYLPENFQYFGLWVLACFILQSWFGFRLARLLTTDVALRTLACVFFAIAPPMLFRLGGHLALAGHFLILAALYGSLGRGNRPALLAWTILVSTAALVHAYLLVMVLAIWSAGLFDRLLCRETSLRKAGVEGLLVIGVLVLVCWQAGYFAVSGGATAWGYGFYRMNLLSPVDPDAWSRILLDLPGGEGDGEGFGYLGLGMLLLLVVGGCGLLMCRPAVRPLLCRHRMLVLVTVLMMVYAWSDQVGLGSYRVELGYAGLLGGLQDKFRASGRFFWPAYYLLMMIGLASVIATFKPRHACWIIGLCVIIQIYDTSAGWRMFQPYRVEAGSVWNTNLSSKFWSAMEGRYDMLRALPPESRSESWSDFSALAAAAGMSTDIVYLARVNEDELEQQRARSRRILANGSYDPRTLYILDDESAVQARNTLGDRDFLGKIDGFNVLAPGGRDCHPCTDSAGEIAVSDGLPGQTLLFGNGQHHDLLVAGWSGPEPWGVWTDGPVARIELPAALPQRVRLHIMGYAYGPNAGADILVRIGSQSGTLRLPAAPGNVSLEFQNPDNASSIELIIPSPASPFSLGNGEDRRQLGVALMSIRIQDGSNQSR